MNKKLFGERLTIARRRSGLSLRDLSLGLNGSVSHTALAKYEKGVMFPSTSILISLSKFLKLPIDYFYNEVQQLETVEGVGFKVNLGKREMHILLEGIRSRVEEYIFLAIDRNYLFGNQPGIIEFNSKTDIMEISKDVRDSIGLGLSGIRNLIFELELSGIITLFIDCKNCFNSIPLKNEKVWVIAINSSLSEVERRYHIAFELGRHILRGEVSNQVYHKFALSFILPPTRVFALLGNRRETLSGNELRRIKEEYGLSITNILELIYYLHIISRRNYQKLKKEIHRDSDFLSLDKSVLKNFISK